MNYTQKEIREQMKITKNGYTFKGKTLPRKDTFGTITRRQAIILFQEYFND